MDGRIGWPPANGHHANMRARELTMAGVPRDRVIIDLRGIGDAVRSAAVQRRTTVAHLARQALLSTIAASEPPVAPPGSDCPAPSFSTTKLTLRMPQPHADALIVNAVGLGLSYGEYVARLVNRTPLPRPAADRAADRAAPLKSSDQLAVLSADLNALVRLLRHGSSTEAEKYCRRIETVDADIRGHLDLASKLMADPETRRSR
jgi:hypothetical protein